MQVALLGSWDPAWIKDHLNWLENHGPHMDGWKDPIGRAKQDRVAETIASKGYLNFYAYEPVSRRGGGQVGYRLECNDLKFLNRPSRFQHEHGNHFDYQEYDIRVIFKITNITALQVPLHPSDFKCLEGYPLKSGSSLRRMRVVLDTN